MSVGADIAGAATGAAGGFASGGPIGAAVGGIGGLLGSIFGNNAGNANAKAASDALAKNVPTLINTGNSAAQTGLQDLGGAGSFYKTILGGNREAISNLLGPQVSTVLSQYDNAANAVRQFAPRGGGATSTLAALPFAKATAAGQAYQGALPGAAAGLAGVGAQTAGIGNQQLSTAAAGTSPYLNQGQFDANQAAAAGKGYGQILTNGLGGILKGIKGPGGSGSNGTTPGWDTNGVG